MLNVQCSPLWVDRHAAIIILDRYDDCVVWCGVCVVCNVSIMYVIDVRHSRAGIAMKRAVQEVSFHLLLGQNRR